MSDAEFGRMSIKDGDSNIKPISRWSRWFEAYVQPCIAEVIGTTMFLFIGIMAVASNTDGTGRLQPALAHGLALGLSIAVLGGISGGHFNPAVSLGATIMGGLNIFMLIPYWISQLCGGLIAAGLAKAMTPEDQFNNVSGAAFTTIQLDEQIGPAIGAEIIMTFYLVLAVCMGAINEKTKTPLAPFAIGFTVTVGVLAGGDVSGACMNPARAFGPAVVANYWDYHWVYWVGPMVAGVLVGTIIRLLIGDRKTRLFLKGT